MGVEVTLTDESWNHIVQEHPEMAPHRDDLGETIRNPSVIYEHGTYRHYFNPVRSPQFGRMFLHAIAIANPNHFVVTAWLGTGVDDAPQEAQLVWFQLKAR